LHTKRTKKGIPKPSAWPGEPEEEAWPGEPEEEAWPGEPEEEEEVPLQA
jgi:hypothetical protein